MSEFENNRRKKHKISKLLSYKLLKTRISNIKTADFLYVSLFLLIYSFLISNCLVMIFLDKCSFCHKIYTI